MSLKTIRQRTKLWRNCRKFESESLWPITDMNFQNGLASPTKVLIMEHPTVNLYFTPDLDEVPLEMETQYLQVVKLKLADSRPLYIHRAILNKMRPFEEHPFHESEICQNMSLAAGQILVHYLYTDTFQLPSCRLKGGQTDLANTALLQASFEVLTCAQENRLRNLDALAKDAIDDLIYTVEPLAALEIILKAYPCTDRPSIDWMQDHLESLILSSEPHSTLWEIYFRHDTEGHYDDPTDSTACVHRLLMESQMRIGLESHGKLDLWEMVRKWIKEGREIAYGHRIHASGRKQQDRKEDGPPEGTVRLRQVEFILGGFQREFGKRAYEAEMRRERANEAIEASGFAEEAKDWDESS